MPQSPSYQGHAPPAIEASGLDPANHLLLFFVCGGRGLLKRGSTSQAGVASEGSGASF